LIRSIMFRLAVIGVLLVATIAQIEAQTMEDFRECFDAIRPKSMRRAHGQYKRDCAEELGANAGDTDKKICVVEKYGWYDAENNSFDSEAFKTTINGYVMYSDLSDERKAAIADKMDFCVRDRWAARWRWLAMIRCMTYHCAQA